MKSRSLFNIRCLALLLLSCFALPGASLILNGSFEDPAALNHWVASNVDPVPAGPSWSWPAKDGTWSVDLSGTGRGFISQTFDTVPGVAYTVGFWMAGNWDSGPNLKTMDVSVDGVSNSYTFDITARPIDDPAWWIYHSFVFEASGDTATLLFSSTTDSAYGPAVDMISVDSTQSGVPEPATLSLATLGIAALAMLRRRFR